MALIETAGLTKRYSAVTALDGLSLEVEPGIVGLVGPNGAGKSTLIKILLGLVDATSGSAEVLGLDAAREGLRVRERVGYMPEHDCLPPDQSATNFVIHMARMSGIPPSHARERAAEVLRHVGLFEERYRHVGGYSTGMKQRVKLAQALVHDPELLFLDEPTNGLDPQGRDEMLDLVARTGNEFGISIIMSSHLLSEIERVCEGLIVIESGQLMRTGRIAELTDETAVLAVEVEWDAERLAALLAERGLEVQALGRTVEVAAAGGADGVHDTILDAVVTLELPLVRLERRRRTLEELFQPATEPATETAGDDA
ncbi:MAG: ABC transporter ATP-binding protein [Chloroflexi bacterium]|nr:ABC transporter ATP-binding protein [Chloroflexota bacterium]